jgi:crotonobetaine/carnitine-CoA ligase
LLEFLADRLAHYAVPRYFELIDALPMTTTKRVRKGELRDLGNSARTWDRERQGFTVGRAGLVRTSVKEQS